MSLVAEIRKMSRLALPIVGAQVLIQSMTFVDNIMVGALGKEALASLAVASALYSMMVIVAIGAVGAVSPLMTHAIQQNDHQKIAHLARQSVVFALLLSVVVNVLLMFCEPILRLLGQSEAIIPVATDYIRALMFAVPAYFVVLTLRHTTEGHEDSIAGFLIIAIGAALNIPLNYLLIHGKYGFPALGVTGAGVATAILAWLSLVIFFAYLTFHRRYRHYRLWSGSFRPDRTLLRELFTVGLPLGGAVGVEMSFFASATFIMGTISTVALAAHQIALNAASIVFMIPLGISFAVTIRIGIHRGRGDRLGVRRAWHASVLLTLVTQVLTAIVFFGAPEWIISLYSQSGEVAELAISLLYIAALFQLFDGMQAVGIGALRGMKDSSFAFVATILSFWVFGAAIIAISYFHYDKSVTGVWVGLLAGLAAASIMHHSRMFYRSKVS